jgi:hypothetical protein
MLRKVFALPAFVMLAWGTVGAEAQPQSAHQAVLASSRTPVSSVTQPLAPGAAAGVKQAQAQQNRLWNFAPFAFVGGLALVVVLIGEDEDDSSVTTTGSN